MDELWGIFSKFFKEKILRYIENALDPILCIKSQYSIGNFKYCTKSYGVSIQILVIICK